MIIQPNKLFLEYLQRVLPLFTDKFSDKTQILGCGINDDGTYYIIVPNDIGGRAGNKINITKLLFHYPYKSYEVCPTTGNKVLLNIAINGKDKNLQQNTFVYVEFQDDIVPHGYYKVTQVKYNKENDETILTIDIDNANGQYFTIKQTQPIVNIYLDYGNTLSGYNGLKEIIKIESILHNGQNHKKITLKKDDCFNFDVDHTKFTYKFAQVSYSLYRITHAIPEEFKDLSLKNYINNKQNVLLVNIENGRTDDNSFSYYSGTAHSRFIPMKYTLEMYVFLYRPMTDKDGKYNDNRVHDYITDMMHDVTTKIVATCALYKEMMSREFGSHIQGGLQQINKVVDPSIRHLGTVQGNMETYLIIMDMEGSIFAFNADILNKHSMIKTIQGDILFKTFPQIL